jgi:hypothetical protein
MNRPEQDLQIACIKFFRFQYPQRILYANYNNAHSKRQGGINKAMGVLAGVPDLTYLHPQHGLLYIELKAGKGRLSGLQQAFLKQAVELSVPCFVVRSFDQFFKLCELLDISLNDPDLEGLKYKPK